MADCILMQLGSNLHWDQTCKACKCMQSGMQEHKLHWIKLANLQPSVPIRTWGPLGSGRGLVEGSIVGSWTLVTAARG